ncbi:MAG: transposase [Candidatus Omnitrophica bacterium]|nr:transposase [Candidatus Omnitrophota bacterium]
MPIKEIPSRFKALLSFYKKCFTRPQYKNFRDFVLGLIVSDNKTIQEVNDCFGRVDQSSLNRFLTCSEWDSSKINNKRISQIKSRHKLKRGIFICDPTFLKKFGKMMEYANYHYNGMTKKEEWGYFLVNSFFTDGNVEFPVCADFYLRKEDADENHPFKTLREICLEQLDYAMKRLPIWLFIADAGLYADFLIQDIRTRGLKYILGTRITNNISIGGKKRISIEEYLETLTDLDFKRHIIDGELYYLHTIDVSERGVGKEKLLISYKDGDEEEIRINVTNLLQHSDESILRLLLKRWKIETWHRDGKQHLGLEDYQVRKFGAMQKVVCAILVAYTQLILMKEDRLLKPLNRILKTVGEGCRYLRLIALKGAFWLKQKAKDITQFKKILNEQVFVKNAKV